MKDSQAKEWLDVVDDQDRVVGKELRAIIHKRSIRHRAVHILLHNSTGKLLLQKRSVLKDRYPGRWDSSASGHLASGEDYCTAAVRELEEELGIRLEPCALRFLFKLPASEMTDQEFVTVFGCVWDGQVTPRQEEVEEVHWLDPNEIDRLINSKPDAFSPAFVEIWKEYRLLPLKSKAAITGKPL